MKVSVENICDLYRRTGRIELDLLSTTDEATLLEFKSLVDLESARIKNQLSEAKAEHISTGTYRDPIWFAKASAAARFFGLASQRIQTELGKRREARKVANRQTHDHDQTALLKKALEILPAHEQRLVLAEWSRLRESPEEENFNR